MFVLELIPECVTYFKKKKYVAYLTLLLMKALDHVILVYDGSL
jgi:hypothetical protein